MRLSTYSKILIVSLSVIAGLVCAELMLRVYSYVNRQNKLRQNIAAATKSNDIRIVCLGESTTKGAYPKPLEQALKKRFPNKNISVIDEGHAGVNTDQLIAQLPRIATQYKPTIIIAMMGSQDANRRFIRYGNITNPVDYWLVTHSRLYALVRFTLIDMQARNALKQQQAHAQTSFTFTLHPQHAQLNKVMQQSHTKNQRVHEQINKHFKQYAHLLENSDFETFFNTNGLILHCNNTADNLVAHYTANLLTAKYIKNNPERAEKLLNFCNQQLKTAKTDSANGFAFLLIQLCYLNKAMDMIPQTAEFALKSYPGNLWLETCLHRHTPESGKRFSAAWLADIDRRIQNPLRFPFCIPENYDPVLLETMNLPDELVIEKLEAFIPIFTHLDSAYQMLAQLYMKNNLTQRLLGLYNLWRTHIYSPHTPERDRDFWDKILQVNQNPDQQIFAGFDSPMLEKNYRKLAQFCKKQGIILVSMQYPMLETKPLQKMLKGYDVVFVSNAQPFRKLVAQNGFSTYFLDNICGCFGHATDEGNRLIAQNAVAELEKLLS